MAFFTVCFWGIISVHCEFVCVCVFFSLVWMLACIYSDLEQFCLLLLLRAVLEYYLHLAKLCSAEMNYFLLPDWSRCKFHYQWYI